MNMSDIDLGFKLAQTKNIATFSMIALALSVVGTIVLAVRRKKQGKSTGKVITIGIVLCFIILFIIIRTVNSTVDLLYNLPN